MWSKDLEFEWKHHQALSLELLSARSLDQVLHTELLTLLQTSAWWFAIWVCFGLVILSPWDVACSKWKADNVWHLILSSILFTLEPLKVLQPSDILFFNSDSYRASGCVEAYVQYLQSWCVQSSKLCDSLWHKLSLCLHSYNLSSWQKHLK